MRKIALKTGLTIFSIILIWSTFNCQLIRPVIADESTPSATLIPSPTYALPTPTVIPSPTLDLTPSPTVTIAPTASPSPTSPISVEPTATPVSPNVPLSSITPTAAITPTLFPSLDFPAKPLSSATIRQNLKIRPPKRIHFVNDETVSFVLENTQDKNLAYTITDAFDQTQNFLMEKESLDNLTGLTLTQNAPFKPGKYTLTVHDGSGDETKQEFTWGLVSVNFDKSSYLPQEEAHFFITVLNEESEFACNAEITVTIISPDGTKTALSTGNDTVISRKICNGPQQTQEAMYETKYQTTDAGIYRLTITANISGFTVTIPDSFEVKQASPFSITRKTASFVATASEAIPVRLDITAAQDYSGEIIETVPESFSITPLTGTALYSQVEINTLDQGDIKRNFISLDYPFAGNYKISQKFGEALTDPLLARIYNQFGLAGHDGLDFTLPMKTPVLSCDEGEVVLASDTGAYGKTLVIQHSWGKSYYGHLSSILTEIGQKVSKGEKIALSGNTGLSSNPHLHFSIKLKRNDPDNGYYGKTDPLPYLTGKAAVTDTVLKLIRWNLSLKKGETAVLGYQYRLPQGGPRQYLLGPLRSHAILEDRMWVVTADVSNFAAYASNIPKIIQTRYPEKLLKGGIQVKETTAEIYPEKYYLDLSALAQIELAEESKEHTFANVRAKREELTKRLGSRLIRKLTFQTEEITDFLSSHSIESAKTISLFGKTREGIQRYDFKKDSPAFDLSEMEATSSSGFVKKASSVPVFQYRAADGSWRDYQVKSGSQSQKITRQDASISTFSQEFTLIASDSADPQTTASVEFKLGYEGNNPVNKLTFSLFDNNNTNRVAWKNYLLDHEAQKDIGRKTKDEETRFQAGNIIFDWSDFGQTDWQTEQSVRDHSLSVIFYPQGKAGPLTIDPTITATITADVVTVSASSSFEIELDRTKGGVIDSWYDLENDAGKATQLANTTNGLFDFLSNNGSNRRISISTTTVMQILEVTGTRVIVRFVGNLGAVNYDYILDYTIYATGEIFINLQITNNTGGTVTWATQRAELAINSATNHTAAGDGATLDADPMTPGTNNWIKWVGNGTTTKDAAELYYYSGFNYVEYYLSGAINGFERDTNETQANAATTTRIFKLQVRPDTDIMGTTATIPGLYSADYRTPATLSFATGSEWQEVGADGFNENEGAYTLNMSSNQARFDISGGTIAHYTPRFKLRNYRSNSAPTSVTLAGKTLTSAVEYNLDLKPVSAAYFESDSLEGLWMLDETSGSRYDLSNNANTLTDNNTVTYSSDRKEGQNSADFELTNAEYLNITDAAQTGLDITRLFTICFWTMAEANSGTHGILGKGVTAGNQSYQVYRLSASPYATRIRLSSDGSAFTNFNSDSGTAATVWAHRCVVADGTDVRWYLNGSLDSASPGAWSSALNNTSQDFVMGDRGPGAGVYNDGLLDEVAIFSRNLSSTEVSNIYNYGVLDKIASGGNTGDANSEYLNTSSKNYTFDFDTTGEYFYYGSTSPFQGLNIDLATVGVASSPVFTWQYWNGSSWAALTVTDGASSFTQDGTIYWTAPGDWAQRYLEKTGNLYYVRGFLSSGSFSTNPIENTIRTDIINLQYLGNITTNNQTFTLSNTPITDQLLRHGEWFNSSGTRQPFTF